jgi:hypothetical protein
MEDLRLRKDEGHEKGQGTGDEERMDNRRKMDQGMKEKKQ